MTENDKPLAALRAMLNRDSDTYKQVMDSLNSAEDKDFLLLLSAAFLETVGRVFGSSDLPAAVIEWVGKIRAWSDVSAQAIDPSISEQVILFALGHDDGSKLSGRQVRDTQLLLLPLLVHDQQLDDPAIDELLAAARALTRQ